MIILTKIAIIKGHLKIGEVMNEFIIKEISNDLGITTKQVEATLKLLSEGNTIPLMRKDCLL